MAIKLMKIIPSKRAGKKYTAYFMLDNGKEKAVHFGSKGMRDFTLINNPKSKFYLKTKAERDSVKNAYIRRHKKRENWNNPLSAGALSRWVLWELPSFAGSIKKFKNKFKL
tara:strand:- start:116 stop:448 length:333 start_codon:yes stop_codon:yes gene_type:complete